MTRVQNASFNSVGKEKAEPLLPSFAGSVSPELIKQVEHHTTIQRVYFTKNGYSFHVNPFNSYIGVLTREEILAQKPVAVKTEPVIPQEVPPQIETAPQEVPPQSDTVPQEVPLQTETANKKGKTNTKNK